MQFVGNLLWFVFGGLFLAIEWIFLGILLALTIIGLPFARAAFRIAPFAAFPFGKKLIDARLLGEPRIAGTTLANVLWVILAGFWLALGHAISGCFYCATIVGIPFGLAHFKLSKVCFAPLGKRAVPSAVADEIERRAVIAEADRRLGVAAPPIIPDYSALPQAASAPAPQFQSSGEAPESFATGFNPALLAIPLILLGIGCVVFWYFSKSHARHRPQYVNQPSYVYPTVPSTPFTPPPSGPSETELARIRDEKVFTESSAAARKAVDTADWQMVRQASIAALKVRPADHEFQSLLDRATYHTEINAAHLALDQRNYDAVIDHAATALALTAKAPDANNEPSDLRTRALQAMREDMSYFGREFVPQRVLGQQGSEIKHLWFTTGGKYLISEDGRDNLRAWDATTWADLTLPFRRVGKNTAHALSDDGSTLLDLTATSNGDSMKVVRTDMRTGEVTGSAQLHGRVLIRTMNSDAHRLALLIRTGTGDTVYVVEFTDDRQLRTVYESKVTGNDPPASMALDPKGSLLVAQTQRRMYLVDLKEQLESPEFHPHEPLANDLDFSRDSESIVAHFGDGDHLIDAHSGDRQGLRPRAPADTALSPAAPILVSSDSQLMGPTRLVFSDPRTRQERHASNVNSRATSLTFSPDGSSLVCGFASGLIEAWGVEGRLPKTPNLSTATTRPATWHDRVCPAARGSGTFIQKFTAYYGGGQMVDLQLFGQPSSKGYDQTRTLLTAGVNLTAPWGSEVYPIADGTVSDILRDPADNHFDTLGYAVIVKHTTDSGGGPTYALYAHFKSPPRVAQGASVEAGKTLLGYVGSTGHPGPQIHLHLEVRHFPERVVAAWGSLYGVESPRDHANVDPASLETLFVDPRTLVSEPPVGEIVARILKAHGITNGAQLPKAWSERYTLATRNNAGVEQQVTTTFICQPPDALRVERKWTQGGKAQQEMIVLKGDEIWLVNDRGASDLDAKRLASHRLLAEAGSVRTLHALVDPAWKQFRMPDRNFAGRSCAVLRLTSPNNASFTAFFDQDTWLMSGFSYWLPGDDGSALQEIQLANYRPTDGIQYAMGRTSMDGGAPGSAITVDELKHLDPTGTDLFSRSARLTPDTGPSVSSVVPPVPSTAPVVLGLNPKDPVGPGTRPSGDNSILPVNPPPRPVVASAPSADAQAAFDQANKVLNRGLLKDWPSALPFFQKASDLGHPRASAQLGVCYAKGLGVKRDDGKAVALFQQAADAGDDVGEGWLAHAYEEGLGVAPDGTKAVKWYTSAAEQGNKQAMHNLGQLYHAGTLVPRDPKAAIAWFTKAAEGGLPASQSALGQLLYKGNGVARNQTEGLRWLREAAKHGDADAKLFMTMNRLK